MANFINQNVDVELEVLRQWWERNSKPFAEWFLKISREEQSALLKKACPDAPEISSATRSKEGGKLTATDLLLPEISEDAMLAAEGKICVLFATRRLVKASDAYANDIRLLNDLYKMGKLPAFGNLKKIMEMDTPFIDPSDPEENVQVLSPETSPEQRKQVLESFEKGTLVRCTVWIALKVRRTAIAAFLRALFEEFEVSAEDMWKPSPTFQQLLRGEMEQLGLPQNMGGEKQAPGTPNSVHSAHFLSKTGMDELS